MSENDFMERRKAPRVKLEGQTEGWIQAMFDVTLVDLSTTGALVEHAYPLRPDTIYSLTFSTLHGELTFTMKARVVRTFVARSVQPPEGEPELVYRSGLEFVNPTPEQIAALEQLLKPLLEEEEKFGEEKDDDDPHRG